MLKTRSTVPGQIVISVFITNLKKIVAVRERWHEKHGNLRENGKTEILSNISLETRHLELSVWFAPF